MKYIIYLLTTLIFTESRVFSLPPASDGESLGILLMGSIVSRNQKKRENVALIKELSTGSVRAVKKGFNIAGRFTVQQITSKYIIVSNQSEGEKLIYQDKFSSEFRNKSIAAPAPSYAAPIPSQFLAHQSSYREDGFERFNNDTKMTSAYRDRLLNKELGTILMQATAEPFQENGRIVGFRMFQIDAGSIYDKLGVQENDIITSINGRQLNNVGGAVTLLKSLKGSNNLQIDVRRFGNPQRLNLNVDN